MLLTDLAVTAITNFILAGEAFFVSGLFFARPKEARSAAWYWQLALLALACTALIGGIDHGFFEVHGQTPIRKTIAHVNWFFIGLLTFCILLCTTRQFFNPPWRRYAAVVAAVQLGAYTILIPLVDDYQLVMLNYAPVMLLLLVCNLWGGHRKGSPALTIGILIAFGASAVQAAGIDVFSPLDRNGLYHLGLMAAVWFFYRGGLRLDGLNPREPAGTS